jgi:hypothetical protein
MKNWLRVESDHLLQINWVLADYQCPTQQAMLTLSDFDYIHTNAYGLHLRDFNNRWESYTRTSHGGGCKQK